MSSRLILYPAISSKTLHSSSMFPKDVLISLEQMGMIRSAEDSIAEHHYFIGDHFLQLVSFLGCAPAIELTAPANGSMDFCHIEINTQQDAEHFIADSVLANPRCTVCKESISNWQAQMQHWQAGEHIDCPHCEEKLEPRSLNWRRAAGFVREYISIHGIYPREALPTEALLNKLGKDFSCTWDYFYARDIE